MATATTTTKTSGKVPTKITGTTTRRRSPTMPIDPPVLEYRPGKGARFVYSPEAVVEITDRLNSVYDLLTPEFLAKATPVEIGQALLANEFALSSTGDERFGISYETSPITLADNSQFRIGVVVTKNNSVKIDFRTWYIA